MLRVPATSEAAGRLWAAAAGCQDPVALWLQASRLRVGDIVPACMQGGN